MTIKDKITGGLMALGVAGYFGIPMAMTIDNVMHKPSRELGLVYNVEAQMAQSDMGNDRYLCLRKEHERLMLNPEIAQERGEHQSYLRRRATQEPIYAGSIFGSFGLVALGFGLSGPTRKKED